MYSPCTNHVLTMHSPCSTHLPHLLWQVSEEFATISAARLLTAQNCWERILFGPRSHHLEKIVARQVMRHTRCGDTTRLLWPRLLWLYSLRLYSLWLCLPCLYVSWLYLLRRQVKRAIDEQVGLFRALLPMMVGAETFLAAKDQSAALVWSEMPRMVPLTYTYTTEAMNAQQQLRERLQASSEYSHSKNRHGEYGHSLRAWLQALPVRRVLGLRFYILWLYSPWQALPCAEFEGVLHPVFEEDEWKLIAVGGLLGMWVGIFQSLFVFGDSATP